MTLIEKFISNNNTQHLFQKKDRLLIAVSGGADSVVLCELCYRAGLSFEIAHCNFQLRGEESERDENFVRSLAEKYRVEVFVKRFDTNAYAENNKVSIQVAARELRYAWFDKLLKDTSSPKPETSNPKPHTSNLKPETSYLLTAHHANDNIETVMMNFFKGTGITGLRGILPKQGNIIRPLLFAKKEEILSFIEQNHLSYVEDSSNSSDKYTRNYFRHQLIPSVQKVFPQVEDNLINNIERFRETDLLFQQSIQLIRKKLLEQKGKEVHIPVFKLLKLVPLKTIVYEIIKDFGFTAHQTDEVINLLKSESGKYISSSTHKIIKNRNWLIIAPVNTLEAGHILIEENTREVEFENGKLKLKRYANSDAELSVAKDIATIDLDNVAFPLLLRKWRQGDYFYPLGMQKKKKLSRFFIDQKLSITDKEKIWVIESNKKIIWIVGKRIDDRAKIRQSTKNILEIRID
jgi:tRNA(Ile)-lysidine synthase